jgi:hypothetical protein
MLELDGFRDRARVHPLQRLESLVRPAGRYTVHDAGRLALTQRCGERRADIFFRIRTDRRLRFHVLEEQIERSAHLPGRYVSHLDHRGPQPLYFTGAQQLDDLTCGRLAQRKQQRRRLADSGTGRACLSHG